jgi:hypothetical protein
MSKKQINEGLFSATDKFISAFFRGLENNTANRVIKQAEKSKLPPQAIKLMKNIEKDKEFLSKILKDSSK